MNLRNFLGTMLSATAGFAILPGATLYTRQWKPVVGSVIGWDIGPGEASWCYVILRNGVFVSFHDSQSGPVPAFLNVDRSGNVYATRANIGTYQLEETPI